MDNIEKGQVVATAAEVYERLFVPALFSQWAAPMADLSRIARGQAVLDVGCGTGALTRELVRRSGPSGTVIGLDVNPGMLRVAERAVPGASYCVAAAENLPFPDERFAAVTSQFTLMFFEDRSRALSEMQRVLQPEGRLSLAVWTAIETSPGYAAMRNLLSELFGEDMAAALDAPFNLGERTVLKSELSKAGLSTAELEVREGTARFASLQSWVETDVRGWTLADRMDEEQYGRLLTAAEQRLSEFVQADGSVRFAAPAFLISWQKPS